MLVDFRESTGHHSTYEVGNGPEPTITTTAQEIMDRTGFSGGPTIVRLVVTNSDGRRALATVSVRLNSRGQARFELSTPHGDRSMRARLTALWKRLS